MFSVNNTSDLYMYISGVLLSIYRVLMRYLTTQKSSKENNDHEERRLEDFQLPLDLIEERRLEDFQLPLDLIEERRLEDFQLPLDLIVEILKKLPSKSLVRFRCVSKQWSTVIGSRRDFIEWIMVRSLRHPPQKLPVFIFHHCGPETFFTVSSTFSQSTKPAVSLMHVASTYYSFKYQYVRGFICCSSTKYGLVTIYNPTTRQCVPLFKIKPMVRSQNRYCYFGYDPVMNQYKMLAMITDSQDLTQTFYVLTLGRDCHHWREIQGNIDKKLFPMGNAGVCVDGTIYYGAVRIDQSHGGAVLLSFDIRSERFYHVRAPEALLKALLIPNWSNRTLFNHLGKLGCICCNRNDMSMWILENAEKQEWSKITFGLFGFPGGDFSSLPGVTHAGEIFVVQRKRYPNNMPLYVYYYDMKQKSLRRVAIEVARLEITKQHKNSIRVFPIHDHVENTMWL